MVIGICWLAKVLKNNKLSIKEKPVLRIGKLLNSPTLSIKAF